MRSALATFLCRFPWFRPRGVIGDARAWLRARQSKRDWYFATNAQECCIERYPGETRVYPAPPPGAGAYTRHFRDAQIRHAPPTAVFFLDNAFIYSHQGAVLSKNFQLFSEFHHVFDQDRLRNAPIFRDGRLARAQETRYDETVALLAGPETGNHYHFLLDLMPRLHLLDPWRDTIERWAVPAGLGADRLKLLASCGVPTERLIELGPDTLLRCRHLVVPSLPGSVGASPSWARNVTRKLMLSSAISPRFAAPLLYVRRGSVQSRPVHGEEELIRALAPLGFQSITPGELPLREQFGLFAQARYVVAAHGAALANILACPPGAALLEIFSPDYVRPEIYWTLAQDLGLRYDCVMAEPRRPDEPWGSVSLEISSVRAGLARLPDLPLQ